MSGGWPWADTDRLFANIRTRAKKVSLRYGEVYQSTTGVYAFDVT
jgi:hypothetical protein